MIDADIPFNRAIIGNHVAAAITLARDDPTVINLKFPISYE